MWRPAALAWPAFFQLGNSLVADDLDAAAGCRFVAAGQPVVRRGRPEWRLHNANRRYARSAIFTGTPARVANPGRGRKIADNALALTALADPRRVGCRIHRTGHAQRNGILAPQQRAVVGSYAAGKNWRDEGKSQDHCQLSCRHAKGCRQCLDLVCPPRCCLAWQYPRVKPYR